MIIKDPIQGAENIVKNIHDEAGKFTQPVLSKYPLVFSFLIVFAVSAILHGFEMWADQINLFEKHPSYLMLIGILVLLATGTLYKTLKKTKQIND